MNFEDEQDLLILSKIYKIDRPNQIPFEDFSKIFEETIGVGWEIKFDKLLRAGIIQGRENYFTTDSGIRKYNKLRKDKRNEETPFWKKAIWYKEQIAKWVIVTILAGALGFLIGLKSCPTQHPKQQPQKTSDTLLPPR